MFAKLDISRGVGGRQGSWPQKFKETEVRIVLKCQSGNGLRL